MQTNLQNALTLALFMQYHKQGPIDLETLFVEICSFSYKGDIRMRVKMENPNKVLNIVKGNLQ